MKPSARSTAFGLASVALWATAASAFKLTLNECTPFQAVFAASAVSALLLWTVSAERRARPGIGDLLGALPRGFLNPFAYYLILLEAYDRLPAQVAMVINYLWPVALILLSAAAFRRRLSGRSIAASALSFSGVVVLAVGNGAWSGRLDAAGLALALASTFIWACYWVLSMKGGGDPVTRLALNFAWGLVFLAAWGLATGSFGGMSPAALAGSAWIGIFEMGLAYILWLAALTHAESTARVGNLVFLTPFASLALIGAVVGEPVTAATLGGLGLVIAGQVVQRAGAGEGS